MHLHKNMLLGESFTLPCDSQADFALLLHPLFCKILQIT